MEGEKASRHTFAHSYIPTFLFMNPCKSVVSKKSQTKPICTQTLIRQALNAVFKANQEPKTNPIKAFPPICAICASYSVLCRLLSSFGRILSSFGVVPASFGSIQESPNVLESCVSSPKTRKCPRFWLVDIAFRLTIRAGKGILFYLNYHKQGS